MLNGILLISKLFLMTSIITLMPLSRLKDQLLESTLKELEIGIFWRINSILCEVIS
jgi:hypothetical protein